MVSKCLACVVGGIFIIFSWFYDTFLFIFFVLLEASVNSPKLLSYLPIKRMFHF